MDSEAAKAFNSAPSEHSRLRAIVMWGLAELFRQVRRCGQWLSARLIYWIDFAPHHIPV